jgi:arylsulfatase
MVEANTVVDVPCLNMDILPSMVKLCGLRLPEKPLDGTDISKLFFSDDRAIEERPQIYFSPMSQQGYAVHCIRKGDWKLRVAQGFGGEVYVNDRKASAHESRWLHTPELYNLGMDPAESYDVAKFHLQKVTELQRELDELMPSFPPNVIDFYAALKQNVGSAGTPAGAEPRPVLTEKPTA